MLLNLLYGSNLLNKKDTKLMIVGCRHKQMPLPDFCEKLEDWHLFRVTLCLTNRWIGFWDRVFFSCLMCFVECVIKYTAIDTRLRTIHGSSMKKTGYLGLRYPWESGFTGAAFKGCFDDKNVKFRDLSVGSRLLFKILWVFTFCRFSSKPKILVKIISIISKPKNLIISQFNDYTQTKL